VVEIEFEAEDGREFELNANPNPCGRPPVTVDEADCVLVVVVVEGALIWVDKDIFGVRDAEAADNVPIPPTPSP